MEMTDHILFVKETKICSYVFVIHTPRLCEAADGSESKTEAFIDDLLRKTLEAIVAGKKSRGGADKAAAALSDEQLVIEFVDGDTGDTMHVGNERLVDALRAAGYDVRTALFTVDDAQTTTKGDVDKHEDDKKKEAASGNHNPADDPNQRDEL